MDVEKTIEFILEQQAQSAVFQTKTEKRFDAISKLLQNGMQMLVDYQRETNTKINLLIDGQVRHEESIRQLREGMDQLREAQQKTDDRFSRWLDAQRGGATNGH